MKTIVEPLPDQGGRADPPMDHVVEALVELYAECERMRGLRIVGAPEAPPHFSARLGRSRQDAEQAVRRRQRGDAEDGRCAETPVERHAGPEQSGINRRAAEHPGE